MTVKSELLRVQASNPNKMLVPEEAYTYAKNHRNGDIAKRLNWDDKECGDLYRIDQIRKMIHIYIVDEEGEPEFVSLSIDRVDGKGYRPIKDVVSNKMLSSIMLQDAFNDLERMQVKYARVKELTSVWNALGKVKAKSIAPKKGSRGVQPRP